MLLGLEIVYHEFIHAFHSISAYTFHKGKRASIDPYYTDDDKNFFKKSWKQCSKNIKHLNSDQITKSMQTHLEKFPRNALFGHSPVDDEIKTVCNKNPQRSLGIKFNFGKADSGDPLFLLRCSYDISNNEQHFPVRYPMAGDKGNVVLYIKAEFGRIVNTVNKLYTSSVADAEREAYMLSTFPLPVIKEICPSVEEIHQLKITHAYQERWHEINGICPIEDICLVNPAEINYYNALMEVAMRPVINTDELFISDASRLPSNSLSLQLPLLILIIFWLKKLWNNASDAREINPAANHESAKRYRPEFFAITNRSSNNQFNKNNKKINKSNKEHLNHNKLSKLTM